MVEQNEGMLPDSMPEAPVAVDATAELRELDLEESLTIADVSDVYRQAAEVFGGSRRIRLKADALEQVDGAGIQLLAAIMREATAQHVEIGWSGVSEALRGAAAQLGLEAVLHFDASA